MSKSSSAVLLVPKETHLYLKIEVSFEHEKGGPELVGAGRRDLGKSVKKRY